MHNVPPAWTIPISCDSHTDQTVLPDLYVHQYFSFVVQILDYFRKVSKKNRLSLKFPPLDWVNFGPRRLRFGDAIGIKPGDRYKKKWLKIGSDRSSIHRKDLLAH